MPKIFNNAQLRLRVEKGIILFLSLLPLGTLAWRAFNQDLGANPVETLTHETGVWALRLLLLSLGLTPLRILFKWKRALLYRRLLGLLAFFYACLHFLTYLVFDQELDFSDTLADIAKRPYITVGFAAFILLVPLAVTSTHGMIKRLGIKAWTKLHKVVYLAAGLVVLHYLWLVKKDLSRPLIYGVILGMLLLVRAVDAYRRKRSKSAAKT